MTQITEFAVGLTLSVDESINQILRSVWKDACNQAGIKETSQFENPVTISYGERVETSSGFKSGEQFKGTIIVARCTDQDARAGFGKLLLSNIADSALPETVKQAAPTYVNTKLERRSLEPI